MDEMDPDVEKTFVYDPTAWKPVSLTHVEYPKGDFLGFLLAWSSLLPIFIIVSFITLIIFRRDLHTICYFLGLLLNEAVNWVVKHTIKEKRPARDPSMMYNQYGMPSSHSQFMWFIASYLLFFLLIRIRHNVNMLENVWKYGTCLGFFSVASVVSFSRVYLGYHSHEQVIWGAAVGTLLGGLWFYVVHKIFTPLFPAIASWPVSEFFMLRDSTLIPNVLWFEYTSHRSEARSRLRKSNNRKSS